MRLQTGAQLLQAIEERRQRPLVTKVAVLDRLNGEGLYRGMFVEIVGRGSCGRFSIGLAALAAATRAEETAALIDVGDHLDPRAAEEAGIDLPRLLWVRPRGAKEALSTTEMALGTGFGVVVLDWGAEPPPLGGLPPGVWMRLARAAEGHKSILLMLSSEPVSSRRAGASAAKALVVLDKAHPMWRADKQPPLFCGLQW